MPLVENVCRQVASELVGLDTELTERCVETLSRTGNRAPGGVLAEHGDGELLFSDDDVHVVELPAHGKGPGEELTPFCGPPAVCLPLLGVPTF